MKLALQILTHHGMINIEHNLLSQKIKFKQMKNLILISFLVISSSLLGQQIDISVSGSWMKTIAPSDISEAGSDYPAAYASNSNQTLLSINPTSNGKTIYVYVTGSYDNWHDNLTLKVRHTSNGNNNSVTGGSIYETITDWQSPVSPFFYCTRTVTNMALQYEITGISVVLPVKSYSATITYTVMH